MKRRSRSIIVGKGQACPKCGQPMQRLAHPPDWRPKPDAPYHFAYWDRCSPCMRLQHYEDAKVLRRTGPAKPAPAAPPGKKPEVPADTAHVEVWRAAARQALHWRLPRDTSRYRKQWLAEAMGIAIWHVDLAVMDRTELITVVDLCLNKRTPAQS